MINDAKSNMVANYSPQLIIIEQGDSFNKLKTANLTISQVFIGRVDVPDSKCNILLNSPLVSKMHGMITEYNGEYYYNDCDNLNGTYYNGAMIDHNGKKVSDKIRLHDGDILSIGSHADTYRVILLFSTTTSDRNIWKSISIKNNQRISIGRNPDNDILIPVITVSRNHAEIYRIKDTVIIKDKNSNNGTYVNGVPIKEIALSTGDIIMIGSTKIIYINGLLVYNSYKEIPVREIDSLKEKPKGKDSQKDSPKPVIVEGNEIVVKDISRVVKCKKGTGINGGNEKYILQNVSLTIRTGELVAICGGSGAGKTTFMNCINGFEPATSGEVLFNGTDLYKNYSSLKSRIGYVPQQDIVHDNLTLESMLTYTARLRLPSDTTNKEIKSIVSDVLNIVDLIHEKDTFIKKLSGGQRKRASIAVELVSDPSIFFLDEPTSGLDPEAETHLMHSLKRLSNEKKKTVVVITHTLQNIDLFDKIVFLAPGGKLCFVGSVDGARKFFEVSNLTDAYEKISNDVDGYVKKFENMRKEAVI